MPPPRYERPGTAIVGAVDGRSRPFDSKVAALSPARGALVDLGGRNDRGLAEVSDLRPVLEQ